MANKLLQKIGISFLLLLLLVSPALVHAQAEIDSAVPGFNKAPLNPAFVKYMEGLENGTIKTLTESGYPLGYIPPPVERCRQVPDDDQICALSLPSTFDLRNTGRLTAVRDQDPYGSCWAFATYSSLESYLKPQSTVNFSENNLMRGHGFDWGPDVGGHEFMSIAYLARWSGPVNEKDDPYRTAYTPGLAAVRHVQQVEFIPNRRPLIKQALIENGAIYVVMYWEGDPYGVSAPGSLISNNYFNPVNNAYYYKGNADMNHAVAIVGWDDSYPRTNFNKPYPPANGAWIIRNSWGTGFGDGGYFYLSYHDTYAGYDATAFHNAEPTTNYNRIYQHDQLGWVDNVGYETDIAWGANIFTAVASEDLAAVSFYAASLSTSYEIRIYTGVRPGNPSSGTLRLSQSGKLVRAGYHTIPLNQPVSLSSGQRFSVVVKFNTPGYDWPVPIESAVDGYSSAVSASPGESFVSHNGIHDWYDISQTWGANVCIKAFTKRAKAQHGNLQITIKPAGARKAKAQWRVTSGPDTNWKNSGTTITDLAPGSYTITFKDITGWTKPVDMAVTLSAGENVFKTGKYSAGSSYNLTVNSTNPASGVAITSSTDHGGTTSYNRTLTPDTSVTLTAPAYHGSGASRKKFSNWSGASSSTNRTISLTMSANLTVTANYVNFPVPIRVTLKSPANNANVADMRVVFQWNPAAEATRYQLQIRKSSDNSIFRNLTLGNVTQRAIANFPADGTQYKWRVRAGNASGWGQWSVYRNFNNGR